MGTVNSGGYMDRYIELLIEFGLKNKMIEVLDIPLVRNQMMSLLDIKEPFSGDFEGVEIIKESPSELLNPILDMAVEEGLINNTVSERDILDAKIMACMMPRQSELFHQFCAIDARDGKTAATDYFYHLSKASNYIRMDRINKNIYWKSSTDYGDLEITINLSKPEKDPKEIAAAKLVPQSNYPKCFLCLENVGYEGNANHPARSNHRVIPVSLSGEQWYFQYSPYVYYNEHAIIFKQEHEPMTISHKTFERLLDFVTEFPHYFVGSNADLPIVGGSILSHEHFQGGNHTFPMETAEPLFTTELSDYPRISLSVLKWPLSVIRIKGSEKKDLALLANHILQSWRNYTDSSLEIYAHTEMVPHNTITPICRVNKAGLYELDLVLRNNKQSAEHPDGIYHPHAHLHHIKKENIGLIEVMGLAVLPARLKVELDWICDLLTDIDQLDEGIRKEIIREQEGLISHLPWINQLVEQYGENLSQAEARKIIEKEVGIIFEQVLACAGVYKQDQFGQQGIKRFIDSL